MKKKDFKKARAEMKYPSIVYRLADELASRVDNEIRVCVPGHFQRGGKYLRGTIVGHGNVPIKQCMYQLKRAGYDDCISIEFEGMEPVFDALRIGLANLKKYWAEV